MASSRRRVVAVVVGASVLSALVGAAAATQIKSPEDAAAERAAPSASRITVPVETRALSSDVILRGDVRFEDAVEVRVGTGEGAIVTGEPPTVGDELVEGQLIVEVAERPVFALGGTLPMYRDILPRTAGHDVSQLEEALLRLGYDPGPLDGVYDTAAEAALSRLYADRGYLVPDPSTEERDRLEQSRRAVRSAERALAAARADLSSGGTLRSTILEAEAAVRQAESEVRVAHARAAEAAAIAADEEVRARVARDQANAAVAVAQQQLDNAPPDEVAERQAELAAAKATQAAAESELAARTAARARVDVENTAAVSAAVDGVGIAQARLAEARRPLDSGDAARAVTDAQADLDAARAELAALDTEIGVVARKSELVFVPRLPAAFTAVNVRLGDVASNVLAEVSGASLVIDAAVSAADRRLLSVGDNVRIAEQGVGLDVEGSVIQLADQPGGAGVGEGRYRMVVGFAEEPDQDVRGFNVRITIPVASTDGDVLAVPIAALSARGDGEARVEVEDDPDEPTRFVDVVAGLSADGYVEVRPVGGTLRPGDRVVVGQDTRRPADNDDAEANDADDGDDAGGG